VYQARHRQERRLVALKVLPPTDAKTTERFARELRRSQELRHPNIVDVFDVAEADGRLLIEMRLIDGRNLDEIGMLEPVEAVAVVSQLAKALDYAHGRNVVHRDVKPANVMIEERSRHVYLLDFGLARAADDVTLTAAGTVLGTPAYMAPEQWRGQPADRRTDTYALTGLLFFALTGGPPFAGTRDELEMQHLAAPPPTVDLDGFDAVIARGMAKAPEERFGSAGELAVAARRALAGHASTTESLTLGDRDDRLREQATVTDRRRARRDPGASAPSPAHRRRAVSSVAALIAVATATSIGLLLAGDDDHGGASLGAQRSATTVAASAPSPSPTAATATPSPDAPATTEPTPTSTPPPAPSIRSFSVATKAANLHQKIRFRYGVEDLGPGDRVVLQKQVGTAAAWTMVKRLSSRGTSDTLTPAHSGEAVYRIAIRGGDGVLAESDPQSIQVYAPVALSDFIQGSTSQTIRIGNELFRWVMVNNADQAFDLSGRRCRHIDLRVGFIAGGGVSEPTAAAQVTVLSERAERIVVTVPNQTVRRIAGRVAGDVQIYAPNLSGRFGDYVYMNGKLHCR
jgi:serine/threonine-protein kinase